MVARLLVLVGLLAGCDSNALSLTTPGSYSASLAPDYLEGDAPTTIVLTFEGIDDVSDATGDPATWQVAADDLDALYLDGYRFISNFQVELDLAALLPECVGQTTPGCERASVGQHTIALQISNHYGTFAVQATVIVFP